MLQDVNTEEESDFDKVFNPEVNVLSVMSYVRL